jgi:hypothetical protein
MLEERTLKLDVRAGGREPVTTKLLSALDTVKLRMVLMLSENGKSECGRNANGPRRQLYLCASERHHSRKNRDTHSD